MGSIHGGIPCEDEADDVDGLGKVDEVGVVVCWGVDWVVVVVVKVGTVAVVAVVLLAVVLVCVVKVGTVAVVIVVVLVVVVWGVDC